MKIGKKQQQNRNQTESTPKLHFKVHQKTDYCVSGAFGYKFGFKLLQFPLFVVIKCALIFIIKFAPFERSLFDAYHKVRAARVKRAIKCHMHHTIK